MVAQTPKLGSGNPVPAAPQKPAPDMATGPAQARTASRAAVQTAAEKNSSARPEATRADIKQTGSVPIGAKPTAAVKPLMGLALYADAESGISVAVFRNKETGEVVEQIPHERALDLYAQRKRVEEAREQREAAEAVNLKA